MRLLVMGAGAMGSVVGAFMARAGHEVDLVGRETHVARIARDGLRITGIWGSHHVTGIGTATTPAPFAQKYYDLILIAVKSYATARAARLVMPLAGRDTLICSYQNGLGNAEAIAAEAGWDRVLGARVIFGARVVSPGEVDVTVIAEPTAIGAYSPRIAEARVKAIAEAMNSAALPTLYTDRIQTLLWSKVAYNCALNPLSALLDVPYGALAENEYSRAIMDDVITELYAVAQAMDIKMEPASDAAYRTRFYEVLLPPTAGHYASMREDLKSGRRTEIGALNGAIVRFGADRDIACPANGLLANLVLAREHIQHAAANRPAG